MKIFNGGIALKINNIYNFKNPIRHFLNVDNLSYPRNISSFTIRDLQWTTPINFRVKKDNESYRILKLPNLLNFLCAYEKFKDYENFTNTFLIDEEHKRLIPNLETGDFEAGAYDYQLENDFQNLCIYDNLLQLDIKSYYGRIYTHHIEFENEGDENFLTNLNSGNTNEIIMGNYISLYFAEKYLKKVSNSIARKIESNKLDCEFSYFSDDFYFFCNKEDNEKVIRIFDEALEECGLERNGSKKDIWTYLEYNNYNLIEKYWRKIMSESKFRYKEDKDNNKLYFINQLIYRMSNLKDDKLRRIFLNTFFKSTYFYELNIEKHFIEQYNYHQLCYIFKIAPETLIYSINKFKYFKIFSNELFKKFLKVRYIERLKKPYHEEQLYYYYTIKVLGFDSLLKETKDNVLKTNNQVLISYYLKDLIFNEEEINKLKEKKAEEYWFQNYHLILFSDLKDNLENSIAEYLMPTKCKCNSKSYNNYMEFYKKNLESEKCIVNDIENITKNISTYMKRKVGERRDVFGENDEIDG